MEGGLEKTTAIYGGKGQKIKMEVEQKRGLAARNLEYWD